MLVTPSQPAAPALLAADDSGKQGDGITDDSSPSLTGTTQPNATVQLFNGSNKLIATTNANGKGKYVFSIPGAPLSPGSYAFSVVASNVGGASPASTAFTLTIVPAPATPSAPMLLPADDSGRQGDGITDDASPSLTGTAFAGATVQLVGAHGTVVATATANGSGNYVIPIPGLLAPHVYEYSVETVDQYGDVSKPSALYSLTIVAMPATPAAPTLLAAESNGAPGGETTTSTSPTLTGTTFANATVELLGTGGAVLNTTEAGGTGYYEIQVPGPLGVGPHSYQVEVIDPYGDVSSPSPSQTITVANQQKRSGTGSPVIVTSVHWQTIKVKSGSGKKAKTKSETALEIQFSGLVTGAGDLGAYQLSSVATKKVKKKLITTYKPIRLTAALPASSPTASSVALVPASKPKLSQTDRLQITAADLTDASGDALDGNDDGVPGGNFVATFSKTGVAFAQPSVRMNARANLDPGAVNAVLEHREDLRSKRR